MTSNEKPEIVADYSCEVGENPLWDERRRILYWTDIPRGRLFRYFLDADTHEQFYDGEPVGGFTLQRDGSLLLFQVNKISKLSEDGSQKTVLEDIDEEMDRFNDVIADPAGRVFAGTMALDRTKGGLYLMDCDGSVKCLFKGTRTANGMGFSPELDRFYWTDTTGRTIYRFDYDPSTGEISNRQPLVVISDGEARPDGMTVDSEGCVWSAQWEGAAVKRFSPDGKMLFKIDVPVPKVSSVEFGGEELQDLYITTAGGGGELGSGKDGALFRLRLSVSGLPGFLSAVMI